MADNIFNPINNFTNSPSLTPLTGSVKIDYSINGTIIDSTTNAFLIGAKIKTSIINK